MSESSASGPADRLEARYRRLLGVFPPGYRLRYGEEMIGVLMAASAPGQRRPAFRESLDLVVSGLRARLGAGSGTDLSPASRSAAAVFGFLASVGLAALSGYAVTAAIAWREMTLAPVSRGWLAQVPHRSVAMAAGWTLVACLCVAGRRQLAALAAAVGLIGEAAVVGRGYGFAPDSLVSSWWLLTLTTFTAACLLALVRPAAGTAGGDPDRRSPLSRRALVVLTAAAVLAVAEPFVARALSVVHAGPGGAWLVQSRIPTVRLPGPLGRYGDNHLGALLLVGAFGLLVLRLRPPVRRRVLLLTAPTVATAGLVETGFQGFLQSSPRFWPPVYLTAGQWSALVLVPLLVFGLVTWLLRRYERKLASGALLA